MVVETAAVEVHERLQRELDAARLALVSLIAAVPDQQPRSVKAELEALAPRSDMSRAALDELRISWQASREQERAQACE